MAPITGQSWQVDYDSSNITLDVLTPNGLIVTLTVSREATLYSIKEDTFYEVQKQPLFGVLKDMQTYIFTCVNITTAEQEELDENRRICDVRPFLGILRLIEKKDDKNEKQKNAKIGLLIGKGLHEFDALKNSEVNDFRWRTRVYCEELQEKRLLKSWFEKINYRYPVRVEKTNRVPQYVLSRLLPSKTLNIELRFSSSKAFRGFVVDYDCTVQELIRKATLAMKSGENQMVLEDYTLKVCGQEEYLLGNHPLIRYKYICEMVLKNKMPSVVVVHMKGIPVDESPIYDIDYRISNTSASPSRRKISPVSSFTVTQRLNITINNADRINSSKNTKVGVLVGLYHGNELLCNVKSTNEETVKESECEWQETLEFDINVRDVPRMAKFCFVIYELVARTRKGSRNKFRSSVDGDMQANPLAWANTTVFDYKSILRSGCVALRLWSYSNDAETEDMLNPLGTCFSLCNPSIEEATCLTITFTRYQAEVPVEFPSMDWILEETKAVVPKVNLETARKERHASKTYLERLKEICDRDPLNEMHEQDKELLWSLREDCRQFIPQSLPHLLHSVKWNKHEDMIQMMNLLHSWPVLPVETALELLDFAYADCHVRGFAVKCLRTLDDDDLLLYLLQLVQALKYESYLYSDLATFLLERALHNQHIGHHLFWLLRSEMHELSVSVLFGLILEAYCRGAGSHIVPLMKQMEAISKLKQMNEFVRQESNKRKESRDKLKSLMHEIINQQYYRDALSGIINPINPQFKLGPIKVEKCKFMDSKMKPLWLVFSNDDFGAEDIYIMFKNGDDLRQDMLTLQMFRIMDKLWKDEGLDLRLTPYRVIATDNKVGLIEIVLKAQTIANIQKEKGMAATSVFKKGALFEWLKDHNPDEESLNNAIEEFTLSCAGYCVATYVLGIADRHSDNIMVKSNGQLLHIDFGHILGRFKEKFGIRRERVPFVLTNDFVYVINKGKSGFGRFQNVCEEAFAILRRKGSFIISLFALMLSSGIPELTSAKDLEYLRETLVLNLSQKDALSHFRSKFEEALKNSWKTSFNWLAHNIVKDNN